MDNNKKKHENYWIEGITPELRKMAEEQLGETEETRTQCLKDIKRMIKDEPDFAPCMEDSFLLRFLRTRKFNSERAFKTLKNYYTFKAQYSGIYMDFKGTDFKHIFDNCFGGALEYRLSNYVGVGVINAGAVDPDKYDMDELISAIMIGVEAGANMEAMQITGYSMVFDFKGFTLRSAKLLASPTLLYRIVFAIQDCIPCRIKSYHFVNEPLFSSIFLTIFRSFLSEKLSKRVFLHGSDLKSLHKHVSPEILPRELGGKQPPLADFLSKSYYPWLYSHDEHFKKMNKFGFRGETLRQLLKGNSKAILT